MYPILGNLTYHIIIIIIIVFHVHEKEENQEKENELYNFQTNFGVVSEERQRGCDPSGSHNARKLSQELCYCLFKRTANPSRMHETTSSLRQLYDGTLRPFRRLSLNTSLSLSLFLL